MPPRYTYAVRICPEPVHWGGLSGCTYSEGVSWGKFVPPEEGGRFAEVYADATTVWPLLMKGVLEELGLVRSGPRASRAVRMLHSRWLGWPKGLAARRGRRRPVLLGGQTTPLYRRYHDEEWGFPVADDRRLFEKLCLEGFQSGLSWLTILRKRESFRAAFAGFDYDAVARFGARDVARLLKDAGIVRHRGKIESTVNNARRARELVGRGGLARVVRLVLRARGGRAAEEAHLARAADDGDDGPPRSPSARPCASGASRSSARPPPTRSCRPWAS